MSQSDFIISDDTFPNYHADLNLMVKALASMSEGATEPATMYAGQPWVDTTANILKMRNTANTGWISIADIDYSNDRMQFIANIYTAASTAGMTFKASGGATILTVSNTGLMTTGAGGMALGGPLDTNSQPVDFSQGANVATATELLLLRDGNVFNLTGTTTVATIENTANAWPIGSVVHCRADGIFQLTHHATNLILISDDDITTAAGDWFTLQKYAAGDWRMMFYQRADGSSVVATPTGWEYTSADTTLTLASSTTFTHGLGAEPTQYEVNLKFTGTPPAGYASGDVIRNIDVNNSSTSGNVTLMVDSGSTTQLRLLIPLGNVRITRKDTQNIYDLTAADFTSNVRWVVKAKL